MIQIKLIDDIQVNEWNDLLNRSSFASFFQSPDCYAFYQSLSFLKPFGFGVFEADGLQGLLMGYIICDGSGLKKYLSRRAIIPGGALLSDNMSEQALKVLLSETSKRLKSEAIYIELRNFNDYSEYKNIFEGNGYRYNPHLNFQIATPDVEIALKNLSSTKRRDVKISLKEGATLKEIHTPDEIAEYYALLHNLYKTRVKTPLFPIEFFEKLVYSSFGKILSVVYKDRIIGGSVFVEHKNKVIYEWFVCGVDGKYKNIHSSTLATWSIIDYAARNGYQYVDMMGAGKPDEGYGVREFKSKFGGDLVEHGRFLYILNPILYRLGKSAVALIKKTK